MWSQKMWKSGLIAALLVGLSGVGCSSSDAAMEGDEEVHEQPMEEGAEEEAEATAPESPSREDLDELGEQINQGLSDSGLFEEWESAGSTVAIDGWHAAEGQSELMASAGSLMRNLEVYFVNGVDVDVVAVDSVDDLIAEIEWSQNVVIHPEDELESGLMVTPDYLIIAQLSRHEVDAESARFEVELNAVSVAEEEIVLDVVVDTVAR